MLLKNGIVLNENFEFTKKDLGISENKITIPDISCDEVLDVSEMYIVPGFIDTHIHGSFGYEITQGDEALDKIAEFLSAKGITTYAPTISPASIDNILNILKTIANHKHSGYTKIGGIHLEGPFVSSSGAISKNIIKPSTELMNEFISAGSGLLKLITIAPELEGIDEIITLCMQNNITVSIGHTSASYEQAYQAYELGATQVTHTFNALKLLHHREPGVVGLALSENNIKCEVICDFVHLHPATVKLLFNAKNDDKINIVSDSCIATGLNDGEYDGLNHKYIVGNGKVTLPDGTITGSALTIYDTIKKVVSIGIPLEKAIKAATLNPAKTLNIHNSVGSIQTGKKADLVVMDKDLNIKYVFIDGKICYENTCI